MKYIIPICLLLAGCATVPDTLVPAPKHHHLALKAPPAVAPPSVAPAVAAPMTKQTFRQRWLSKFFRNRAQ